MSSIFCKCCNQERQNHSAKELIDCTLSLIEVVKT
jgi:hypothetical protein